MTQPELFEELDAPHQLAKRRADKPVFATRRVSWSATYQQLALAGAGIILAFVGAFALGVERGKRVAQPSRLLPSATAPVTVLPMPAATAASVRPASTASRPASASNAAVPPSSSRQYTIQLATYTSRAEAERELATLKKGGYSVYLNEGNQRWALCAGLFPTRDAAAKQLSAFRKKYRDSFVRVR